MAGGVPLPTPAATRGGEQPLPWCGRTAAKPGHVRQCDANFGVLEVAIGQAAWVEFELAAPRWVGVEFGHGLTCM